VQKKSKKLEKQVLLKVLRDARIDARLTQSELSARLGRPQSFVSKYESGERRLDLVELSEVCHAVGISLQDLVSRLEGKIG
jgi:transcriptional regulator with XRE-family HTH domain